MGISRTFGLRVAACVALVSVFTTGYGVPVVDLSTDAHAIQSSAGNATDNMNLLFRLNELQKQVQQLQGQVEVQSHEIQQLRSRLQTATPAKPKGTTQQGGVRPRFRDPAGQGQPTGRMASDPNGWGAQLGEPRKVVVSSPRLPAADAGKARALYLEAYDFLQEKQYSRSANTFKQLLNQYPNSAFSSKAHYWLGELYLMTGESKSAVTQFRTVIDIYPEDKKVPDAMLKLAMVYDDEGRWSQSQTVLQDLMRRYPKSAQARLAQRRLITLQRQGRT